MYSSAQVVRWIVRELKDVRFIAALKKNSISVSVLETEDYNATIDDDKIKFINGVMLILQGVRLHNLYYLKRSKSDELNISEAHGDTIKLWYIRLGHVGEKFLQILMKRGLLKEPAKWSYVSIV